MTILTVLTFVYDDTNVHEHRDFLWATPERLERSVVLLDWFERVGRPIPHAVCSEPWGCPHGTPTTVKGATQCPSTT